MSSSFLNFFNNFNTVMLVIDPDNGKIINANKAAVEYYGYDFDVLTSMFIYDINTLSKSKIYAEQQNALQEKRNYFQFAHKLSSGKIRDVEVYSSPTIIDDQKLLLSIIYDTTSLTNKINSLQNDLDSTFAAIPDLLFELGLDGCYHSVRSTRTELMAAPPKEMLGKTVFDILSADAAKICMEAINEANENKISEGKQFSIHLGDVEKWFELSVALKENIYPDGPHFIVLSRDITNRKKIEKDIQDSESRFKALHDAASGGIAIHEKGLILECNSRLSELFGYFYEELIGMNGLLLISNKTRDVVMNHILNAYEEPYDAIGCKKDGTEFPMRIESREIVYKGKSTRVTEFNDITQEVKIQKQLKHMAHYDSLTNLPNRTLFADRLQQAMVQSKRREQCLAIVYIDIDGFKYINDTYGHDIGDKLLIAISKNMQNALREQDTIARFGGDEFVVAIVDLDKSKNCITSLERLLYEASKVITIESIELQVSASLGVTIYPNDNEDADILIRHADHAMYRAKQDGKNCYHIFNVDEDSAIRAEIENIQKIAIGLENEEFVLHYQPKINMKTGKFVGVEALIRWEHPEEGLLSPMQFLPFIENHSLSCDIGHWVISSALKQIKYWQQGGLEIAVSVNVGAKQLQTDFVDQLESILDLYPEVSPKLLEIEVLETSFLEDISKVSEVIDACIKMGVNFSIDDFGTGYSSLTYLKLLPAKLLKIDKSFICDMIKNSDDHSIVKGIIALSKAFNLNVIAEGVETKEHEKLLLSLGCELAQGDGIAKPMPAQEIPNWVKTWYQNQQC